MQSRPNHRFDRIDQRLAQSDAIGSVNDTASDNTDPNIDTVTRYDTAPKTGATEHSFSELPFDGSGNQIQPEGASGVTIGTRRKRKSAMSRYAQARHKRAARMLGYALTINDPSTWTATGVVLARRLTRMERVSLAYTVLAALEPDDREMAFDAAHRGVA